VKLLLLGGTRGAEIDIGAYEYAEGSVGTAHSRRISGRVVIRGRME